jgi:hypothetical protein
MVETRASSSHSPTWTQSRVTPTASVDAKSTFDGNSIVLKLHYNTRRVLWESREGPAMKYRPNPATPFHFHFQNRQTSTQNPPMPMKPPSSETHLWKNGLAMEAIPSMPRLGHSIGKCFRALTLRRQRRLTQIQHQVRTSRTSLYVNRQQSSP